MQTLDQVAQILTQTAAVSRAEIKRVFTKEKNERRLLAYYNTCQEVTVRGGFPLLVWMDVRGAEPDVGYSDELVEDAEITTINFGSVSFLKLTIDEECKAINDAFDQYLCGR
jgi:hypothetical protein